MATESVAEVVQEFVQSAGQRLRVDTERGVLRGVKLLGLRSRNGRRYEESALKKSIGLYEGSKVNVNHPTQDPLAPRDYRDRLGIIRNVRIVAGDGLFGDLHYNPSHSLAEQLAWDAEHAPENVGLSHNVLAKTRRERDSVVVEAIQRVQSVDLVADPATTAGLFEHHTPASDSNPTDANTERSLDNEVAQLREELEQSCEQLARTQRRLEVESLLREHGVVGPLADAALTEVFLRQLSAADGEDLPSLVEERARFARTEVAAAKPRSCEQRVGQDSTGAPNDTASFVAAVSGPT
ncbi:MAG: hypothetical protein AAF266_03510 [Planctomycetota bacterium]